MADRLPVWETETLGKTLGDLQAKTLVNTFVSRSVDECLRLHIVHCVAKCLGLCLCYCESQRLDLFLGLSVVQCVAKCPGNGFC